MRVFLIAVIGAGLMGVCSAAYCESNSVASGAEKVTSAPFDALRYGAKALNSPVNEVANLVIMVADETRAATVRTALNMGKSVDD